MLLLIVTLFFASLATHALWWVVRDELSTTWSRADWSSAKLLPRPADAPQAMVHVYAARTGRWRGIFAHHSWIVVKDKGAARYVRYDKVGWGSPVRTDAWPADARWFGHEPQVILAIEGEAAERLIPQIRRAVAEYPYRGFGDYRAWPGPNSNTFIAHVLSRVPALQAALPPTAIGKDWHPVGEVFGAHAEPDRDSALARRLRGPDAGLDRGRRGQCLGPRRRPRSAPAGAQAARMGADRPEPGLTGITRHRGWRRLPRRKTIGQRGAQPPWVGR